ncbi:MAG: hypothetical protein MUC97_00440 [Bernardetiaceae bacterium]|jgi:phenylacetate-CoA ligase|nr:hypothetical protein [Bernardetiaceae bacterium]
MYPRLPVWLQNVGISAFGYHWYRRRFGGVFAQELRACLDREAYSAQQWSHYQTERLQRLLLHAQATVPYYQQLFKTLGLGPAELKNFTLEQLPRLPLLDKATFRQQGTSSLLSCQLEPNGEYYNSSGSTGTPTRTRYSLRMHQQYFAIFEARINYWAGIDYQTPRGVIGGRRIVPDGPGRPPYYRYNWVEKQTYFSAYHIGPGTVKNYLEGLRKHRAQYLTGYASGNYFLARLIEEAGLAAPQLQAVLTSSEMLTPDMRATFGRVYGCKTYDSYNGVEVCNLISECEHGKLHVVPEVGIVEVLDARGRPCPPGQPGEVVSTGLLNFDQPLIRYRMGDLITLSPNQTCACGRAMPVVEEIVGRLEDTIIGPDGREMVRFHGVFIGVPGLVEAQIVQHTLTDIEVNLVGSAHYQSENNRLITNRIISQLGPVKVHINLVPSIPRTHNGKFKAVISHVKRPIPA